MGGATGTGTLYLAGDLMLGRGVDQAMPDSCSPELREPYIRDARHYLRLVEQRAGELNLPFGPEKLWGEVLPYLGASRSAPFIGNLETAVTTNGAFWPEKGIHYRMHPENLAILKAAGVDAVILANNHAMDFGRDGLGDTLRALADRGIPAVGAGRRLEEARRPVRVVRRLNVAGEPATLGSGGGNCVAVVATAMPDSGTPLLWSAERDAPGLFVLRRPGAEAVSEVADAFASLGAGTPRVLSIHWGGNWGYDIPEQHRSFARRLVDEGIVDLVFGHSSHHPKEVEFYRQGAIIYGAGDLINDYEGLGGHREFRPELGLLYRATFRGRSLLRLEVLPVSRQGVRLRLASAEERRFLGGVICGGRGVTVGTEGWLRLG